MITAKKILEDAKLLILSPEKWIKGRYQTYHTDGNVNQYCAAGALSNITQPLWGQLSAGEFEQIKKAQTCLGAVARTKEITWEIKTKWDSRLKSLPIGISKRKASHVEDFNDATGTTHTDILNLFDEAIAKASDGNG